ncbi:AIPR family protein [Nocardia brasiliensis]|uniref:AIPR family protein n=1 Tax=Nocardia brasiliensis TaxID=37326 RepID=UPI0037AEF5C6
MNSIAASTLQVGHVRRAILREFDELLDMSDVESKDPAQIEQCRVSRALSALAARMLVGCDANTAAGCVIDGRQDHGIDAIAFADGTPELYLIQTKWSDRGTAGIKASYVRDLVDGFRKIEDQSFTRFNPRFHAMSGRVKSLIQNPKVKVTLVLAMMGDGHVHPDVQEEFNEAAIHFNSHGRFLDFHVLTSTDFWEFIRADMSPNPVELIVPMTRWLPRDGFSDSYFGIVSVDHLAKWFEQYGNRLFESNVRKALGLTGVNQGMIETLLDEPDSFWAKNNGITVLCSKAERTRHYGSRFRNDEPIELTLSDAKVVNGAQTVHAAYRASQDNAEQVGQADVMVRVISVPAEMSDFGKRITQSTNTQNHIEPRDFIALDETQAKIRDDFMLSLDLTYVFHRGDSEPPRDSGCSVAEAAVALACAHRNSAVAVRTKISLDTLWEQGRGGTYPLLFGNQPPALEIWRSVQLHRRIRDELEKESRQLRERARAVAEYGDLLLAHICFRLVESDEMEDPETDWEQVIDRIGSKIKSLLRWLIVENDSEMGSKSFVSKTFTDEEKCEALSVRVLGHAHTADPIPPLPEEYRPPKKARRPRAKSAVSVILDASHLQPGVPLRYYPLTPREEAAISEWLAVDPRRARASWVIDRRKPVLWEADGKRYSPTGLVMHMWEQAGWNDAPVAVQGTKCWFVPEQGSLATIAEKLRTPQEELLSHLAET